MVKRWFRYLLNFLKFSATFVIFQWSSNSRLRWSTTILLHVLSYVMVVLTAPISLFFVLRRIKEYERAVVLGSTLAPVSFKITFFFEFKYTF